MTTKLVGTLDRETANNSLNPPGLLICIAVLFKKSKASYDTEWISTWRESPFTNGDKKFPSSSLLNFVTALLIGGIKGIPSIIAPSEEAPASIHVIMSCKSV